MSRVRPGWILSPLGDALVFTGPVVLGLLAILAASGAGWLDEPLSPWLFLLLIVGCDVSHVWATGSRVYLDPEERRRRPSLYLGVPLACFAVGVLLHAQSPPLFWRALAYLAAYHFVRQQWGWMAFSRYRAQDSTPRWIDRWAIDQATLFPLLWWHLQGPREFHWFLEGDFIEGLATWSGADALASALHALHLALSVLYVGVWWWTGRRQGGWNVAKLQIWATTWVAWYGGIVWWNSDLAFTVLNVLAHGVPYLAFVWRYEQFRWRGRDGVVARVFTARRWALFFGALVFAAFLEEWMWDRAVWHEHGGVFPGAAVDVGAWLGVLVPLLAVPQATHYVLDGWLWRTSENPALRRWLTAA